MNGKVWSARSSAKAPISVASIVQRRKAFGHGAALPARRCRRRFQVTTAIAGC